MQYQWMERQALMILSLQLMRVEKIDKEFLPIIQSGIDMVCQNLAKNIARDGEGASCLLEVLSSRSKKYR